MADDVDDDVLIGRVVASRMDHAEAVDARAGGQLKPFPQCPFYADLQCSDWCWREDSDGACPAGPGEAV